MLEKLAAKELYLDAEELIDALHDEYSVEQATLNARLDKVKTALEGVEVDFEEEGEA